MVRKLLKIIILIASSIVLLITLLAILNPMVRAALYFNYQYILGRMEHHGDKALEELKRKYGEDFVIVKDEYREMARYSELKVAPVLDRNLVFNVEVKKDGDELVVRDDYFLKKDMNPIIESIIGKSEIYFEVNFFASRFIEMPSEVYQKYTINSGVPSIRLLRVYFSEEPNFDDDAQILFELINKLKKLKINSSVRLEYLETSQMPIDDILEQIQQRGVFDFTLGQSSKVHFFYDLENIMTINDLEDIKKNLVKF